MKTMSTSDCGPAPERRRSGTVCVCTVLGSLLLGTGCRASATFTGTPAPGRPEGSLWEVGAAIAHYYQGPGAHPKWGTIAEHGSQLAELGFNLAWCPTVEDLDAAHTHGMRGLAYGLDPGKLGEPGVANL